MDKRLWTLPGLWVAGALALAALLVRVVPSGYGMSALTLLGLAAVVCFYTLARRGRKKKLMICVSAVLAVCFGLFLAAEIPVIAGARSDRGSDADHLVVMGAGIHGTQPSLSMRDRLVMAVWLEAHGVAPERILLEEQADSTRENILNSYAVAAQHGGGRVAFVSSEYHLCRMRMLIRSLGFEPVCVAAHTSRPSLLVNYAIREAFAVWQIWIFGPGA